MILYIDIVSRTIISSPKLKKEITRVEVKRGDILPLAIVFIQNGQPVEIDSDNVITFCAKLKYNNEGSSMVIANNFGLSTEDGIPKYEDLVNFNGASLANYLTNQASTADDYAYVDLQMEINWLNTVTTENNTTNTVVLRVYNDIYKGGEVPPQINPGIPFQFPDGIKTNLISPLTTGQAIVVSSTLAVSRIHGNIAGNVYSYARASEALTKGDPVYVSGYYGSGSSLMPTIAKADASNSAKMPAIGIMDANALNQASCNFVISGSIAEFNTNSYAANAELYVANGGGLTATQPTLNCQPVARVERSNTSNGAILVSIAGVSTSGGNGSSDAGKLARFNSSGKIPYSNISGFENTAKTTPVDNDRVAIFDSAASNAPKYSLWSSIKATLKTYFDTVYAAVSHTHTSASITDSKSEGGNLDAGKLVEYGVLGSINTSGSSSYIYTSGQDASIYTGGENASIYTEGSSAVIGTSGFYAEILTSGDEAHISTSGINAHILTRSTFKIWNGTSTTTLASSQSADRTITFPDATGTVALTNDPRFTNARTPTSHSHGAITNDGKIGSESGMVLLTTTSGIITTSSRTGIDDRTEFPAVEHFHGAIKPDGSIGTEANLAVITGAGGLLQTFPREGIDTREDFPPESHQHGNITNNGAIGLDANLLVITTTNGVLTTITRNSIDTRTTFPNEAVNAASSGGNGSSDANKLAKFNNNGNLPVANISGLATVATSGSYLDLSNKPSLGTIASKSITEFVDTTTSQSVAGDKTFTGILSTSGLGSTIRTRTTFEMVAIGATTTIAHNASSNRTITLPDRTGTVAITPSGPYANDTAAAAASIPVGGLYYLADGTVKVRLT
jgi:hypothetical protein